MATTSKPSHLRTSTAALIALIALASCSLTVVDAEPCSSDPECEELFGGGSICGGGGFCEVPAETSETIACQSNEDCLAAEGFGSTCSDATDEEPGTCESIRVPGRCTRSLPADLAQDPSAYRDRIVIGVLSDQALRSHTDRENAIELAVTQINENQGLGQAQLAVLFCDIGEGNLGGYSDSLPRPEAADLVTEFFVNEASLAAIIGAPSSNDTQLIFEDVVNKPAVRGRTVLMSASATDPSLVDFDVPAAGSATDNNPGLLWRTAGDGTAQIEALVADMGAAGVTNVIIVREQSPFAGTQLGTGGSFAQSFLDSWSGDGEQLTYAGGSASARDQKILEAVEAINGGEHDALLFVGPTEDAQAALAGATAAKLSPDVPIYFDAAGANDELFEGIADGSLFANVRASAPVPNDGMEFSAFASAYQSAFGAAPSRSTFTAEAYDATWLLAAGAVWAIEQGDSEVETESGLPVIRGDDIARGMRRTAGGTQVSFVPGDWQKVLTQFRAGRSIDVAGAANDYDFDLGDEQAPSAAAIVVGTAQGRFMDAE